MGTKLSSDLVFLILQFLNENRFSETARKLEQESLCYFNMEYFESQVLAGEWDKADCYLSSFTTVGENSHSTKTFFEIRKQKYLEALDMKDYARAVEILRNDLKVFENFNSGIYKELADLIPLGNIRENEQLSNYGDATSQRQLVFLDLQMFIKGNPQICNKLKFPHIDASRLRTLINQSLNWQHQHCKNPASIPDIKTLFFDHICAPLGESQSHTNNSIAGAIQHCAPYFPVPTHAGVDLSGRCRLSLTGRMANPEPSIPHLSVTGGTGLLKQLRTPTANITGVDYQFASPVNVCSHIDPSDVTLNREQTSHNTCSGDDLPMKVVRSLCQGSKVISMDFHPQKHSILLVGTSTGDLGIWDVGSAEKLVHKIFGVWSPLNGTTKMQSGDFVDEPAVSVNRCIWSPNGEMAGVAFSKSIVRIYSYFGSKELNPHLEINAHIGGVNDIAFNCHNQQLSVITCGDDKCIKVWDAVTGHVQHTFEGHESPVYCVFPHQKENTQFILSTTIDGKIKAWFYDGRGSTFDYDVPGKLYTTIAYSDDRSRLFSCGTSKEGEPNLVELNESDGTVKRTYCGLQKHSVGVVHIDTTRNRFLAVGDDNQIKFWDMDNVEILATTYVEEGCLEPNPCLCFNKEGSFLAVSTKNSGIMILANADGLQLLRTLNNEVFCGTKVPAQSLCVRDEDANKIKKLFLANAFHPIHCKTRKLPDGLSKRKIIQILYTDCGSSVLALDSNACHKRWTWSCNEGNPTGKVTVTISPGSPLESANRSTTHDSHYEDPEKQIPCMAVSNNDDFLISTSGREVSVRKLQTFEFASVFLLPSPPATSFALHPEDNNIIAFGLENSKILMLHVKNVTAKMLESHHRKEITSVAFSLCLDLLISAGADGLLCAWNLNEWDIQQEQFVYPHGERSSSPVGISKINFHKDQVHLLVVQENQIAIHNCSTFDQTCHWQPQDPMPAPILSAQYSCDSQLVYASFCDCAIGVFDADVLRPLFNITPAFFLLGMRRNNIYPLAIAAHPQEYNQLVIGFSDGEVHLIELVESQGEDAVGSLKNGEGSSDPSTSNHGSELPK